MYYSDHQCCLLPPKTQKKSSSMITSTKSKLSTSRRIKNILKPVLSKIFKSSSFTSSSTKSHQKKKSNSYISSATEGYYDGYYSSFDWWDTEHQDNEANEELEDRLIEEIQNSPDDAAIFIFNDSGVKDLKPINKQKFYIPVHFARTNAGTFFWTSAQKPIDSFRIEWNFLDRWAQA